MNLKYFRQCDLCGELVIREDVVYGQATICTIGQEKHRQMDDLEVSDRNCRIVTSTSDIHVIAKRIRRLYQ